MFKSVRDRENSIANMRDAGYEARDAGQAKDDARNARMHIRRSPPSDSNSN